MHALIIEDSYLIAAAIRERLRDLDFTTSDLVARAVQAVAVAKVRCPDLIIAAARLADGCGVTAVQEICGKNAIPVIVIVGEKLDLASVMPHAAVLAKPFSDMELVKAVRDAFNLNCDYQLT